MKTIRATIGMGAALLMLVVGLVTLQPATPAAALESSGFDPGYIISDANFYDRNAMSEVQIQAFLDANIGTCGNGQCLNVLKSNVASRGRIVSDSTGNVRCEAFTGGSGLSAATIIYRTQVACSISAKVILVTLQKEQGLIDNRAPGKAALDRAMGFACPDTAPCAVDSLGFANQIYKGALQLNTYRAARFARQPGVQNVQWHPNASCGSSVVNVQNDATAALYNYTPYRPNAAALANLGGTGDGCSSYGNRNFWVFYNNWFGSTTGAISPVGSINEVTGTSAGISLRGWTFDYSSQSSVKADVYVNGAHTSSLTANLPRPDVAAAYAGIGANSGFSAFVPLAAGAKNVCVYGINIGPGQNSLLGCQTVTVSSGNNPVGDINSVTASAAGATIRGWAFDADTTSPIKTDVWVDGKWNATLRAEIARPDVKAAFPNQGTNHGFQTTIVLDPGAHRICAYGINNAAGLNPLIGCGNVTVPTKPVVRPPTVGGTATPRGDVNSVTASTTGASIRGWAFDADTSSPIKTDIWVDGKWKATLVANGPRPDVKAAYPAQGPDHGFQAAISLTAGAHRVCAYGINVGAGANPLLGCRSVTVPSSAPAQPPTASGATPRGDINSITTSSRSVAVRGWVFDPDTKDPIRADVWIDGIYRSTMIANVARPDVQAVFPTQGASHGFQKSIVTNPGARSVCVYGINAGGGTNPLLGCRQVVVPD